jgi:hypothetical protein
MFQARQGDIFFEQVESPKGKQKQIQPVIAYGEVTGHAHRIISPSMDELESYVDENGDIYVLSKQQPIQIGHEEHGQVTLPPNQWMCITRQREYDPIAAMKERQVAD